VAHRSGLEALSKREKSQPLPGIKYFSARFLVTILTELLEKYLVPNEYYITLYYIILYYIILYYIILCLGVREGFEINSLREVKAAFNLCIKYFLSRFS
jgi:hypothetical protein